jgi:hypothetical protein
MNNVTNVFNDYDKTWIIIADKKLSDPEKTNAVRNLTASTKGRAFSFVMNKSVIFDITEMIPRSAAEYTSLSKKAS